MLGTQSTMPFAPRTIPVQADTTFLLISSTCTSPKDTCSLEEHSLSSGTDCILLSNMHDFELTTQKPAGEASVKAH